MKFFERMEIIHTETLMDHMGWEREIREVNAHQLV
jgi:hypothetical protein